MEELIGGLEYCKCEGCTETVFFEDAPDFYPFCDTHTTMNKSYYIYRQEQKAIREIRKELNII